MRMHSHLLRDTYKMAVSLFEANLQALPGDNVAGGKVWTTMENLTKFAL